MPRELVHWEVLLRAAERAKEEGAKVVSDLVDECRDLALIGAVAHDAPYYFRAGGDPFEKVANGLHGLSGLDTFHSMRILAGEIASDPDIEFRRSCWGFLLGMMSHAVADQWFHPWVFYFTGDYYHPDRIERLEVRRRHRLLEVYMDSWVRGVSGYRGQPMSLLALLQSQRGYTLDLVTELLGSVLTRNFFFPEEVKRDTTQQWRQALWHQAFLKRLFTHAAAGFLLKSAAQFGGATVRSIEALSSFRRSAQGAQLNERYEYKNPSSGDPLSHTLQELLDSAVEECARLFIALDAEIGDTAPPAILRVYRGVSLNYGAWGVGPGEAQHYSAKGLSLPGLSFGSKLPK